MPNTKQDTKEPIFYTYGFIALERMKGDAPISLKQPVCLALVSFDLEDPATIYLDEVRYFTYKASELTEELVKFNCKQVGIDEENYNWIIESWTKSVNTAYQNIPGRRGKLPILKPYKRDNDLLLRQLSIISSVSNLSIATHLGSSIEMQLRQYGTNLVPDAVAGAIAIAQEQLPNLQLKGKLLATQSTTWMGLERQEYPTDTKPQHAQLATQ